MKHTKHEQERGAALIMALIIVSIITMLATSLFFSQSMMLHNALASSEQTRMHADERLLLSETMNALRQKAEKNHGWPSITASSQNTARNGRNWNIKIWDAQALWNINQSAACPLCTQHLIEATLPSRAPEANQQALQHLLAWLGTQQDADDADYQKTTVPYRSAHSSMLDSSELQLVEGWSDTNNERHSLAASIAPWVSALPSNVRLNAEDATPTVLHALLASDPSSEEAISTCQKSSEQQEGNPDQLFQSCLKKQAINLPAWMGLGTHYAVVQIESNRKQPHSLRTFLLYLNMQHLDAPRVQVVYAHTNEVLL